MRLQGSFLISGSCSGRPGSETAIPSPMSVIEHPLASSRRSVQRHGPAADPVQTLRVRDEVLSLDEDLSVGPNRDGALADAQDELADGLEEEDLGPRIPGGRPTGPVHPSEDAAAARAPFGD